MIGRTLGNFEILELLGRGGMGEVYLGLDTRLDRRVAIKFLAPELAGDRQALNRFNSEARAVAELDHPNIAGIHDVGEVDGRPYLVLEFVNGPTLKQVIAAGPMPVDRVVELGEDLASALAESHARGIVHRDIKPANILLTERGVPKIVDFGLAMARDATRITAAGTTLGTVGYMSPEQLEGKEVGPQADVWSLGVVLYECLTGRHPFAGTSTEGIGYRVMHHNPEFPSGLRSGIPSALEALIMRCLEKSPGARLQDAQDLQAALRAVQGSSHPDLPSMPGPRETRGRALVPFAVAATVALVLLVLFQVLRQSPTGEGAGPPRLAIMGFEHLSEAASPADVAGLLALVHSGLAGDQSYSVVSPEYLREIQRREAGRRRGPLETARDADATYVLAGDLLEESGERRLTWRIVDAVDGRVAGTGTVAAESWSELAALVSRAVDSGMGRLSTASTDTAARIRVVGSSDPRAYGHYSAAMLAIELGRRDQAREELLRSVALDSTFALAAFALSQIYDPNYEAGPAMQAAALARRHAQNLGPKESMLLEAHRLLLDYQVASALEAYDEFLVRWPDSVEGLLGRARTCFYFRYWRPALDAAREGLRYYPTESDFLDIQVGALFQLGQWRMALPLARERVEARDSAVDAPATLADIHLRMGEFERAEELYREMLVRNPADVWGIRGVAWCAYGRGDLAGAVQVLSDYVESPDTDAASGEYALVGLRVMLADQGRSAFVSGETSSRLEEQDLQSGDLLYAHRPAEALAVLDQDMDPMQPDGTSIHSRLFRYGGLVRAWIAIGDLERARAGFTLLQDIVDRSPELPRGFVQRNLQFDAELAFAEGDFERAERVLAELFREGFVRLDPGEIMILELEASVQDRLGRPGRAIELLEELVGVFGGRTLARFQLAQLYERTGEHDSALEQYRRCLQLWSEADPEYPYPEQARRRMQELEKGS